ncbi:hypothetical protein CC80DRAFT_80066 [Byssothecium circinans]|uniref:Uncharacterized protein n=1 Tax=Byssothecium circinans TaxID=147558 RepID=A0A6A5TT67_9PLEO|nr:hypothetical protein CC80DRAFT_80066 [Byssothecium circinans]
MSSRPFAVHSKIKKEVPRLWLSTKPHRTRTLPRLPFSGTVRIDGLESLHHVRKARTNDDRTVSSASRPHGRTSNDIWVSNPSPWTEEGHHSMEANLTSPTIILLLGAASISQQMSKAQPPTKNDLLPFPGRLRLLADVAKGLPYSHAPDLQVSTDNSEFSCCSIFGKYTACDASIASHITYTPPRCAR